MTTNMTSLGSERSKTVTTIRPFVPHYGSKHFLLITFGSSFLSKIQSLDWFLMFFGGFGY